MNEIKIGDYVESLQGRDTKNIYIVKQVDGEYIYLVDGKGKTVDKPKKKKIKHIKVLNKNCKILADKFANKLNVFDAEIRKHIKNIENS